MDDFRPDAYCGIYCGACSIAMHGATGRADRFALCLGRVPREDLECGGCRSDTVYAGCGTCGLRRCAGERGVAHCVDCAEYPCKRYRTWQSVAKLLPHSREAPSNLEAIRRGGAGSWLAAQKARWSCPDCGAPFSWYARQCGECGRRLTPGGFDLSGWKRLLSRIVLPMAYRKGKAQQRTDASP